METFANNNLIMAALTATQMKAIRGGDDTRGGDVEGDPELDLD